MTIRERVKRVLGRSRSAKSTSTASSTLSKKTSKSDSSVWYQPGEPLPTPKYRRPVAKEHKEMLEAFKFETAWRTRSAQSIYSPMGSRYASRRNSLTSRKSANAPPRQMVEHIEDAESIGHAGLSPQRTLEIAPLESAARRPAPASHSATCQRLHTATLINSGAFTQHELNLALKRSNLEVAASAW